MPRGRRASTAVRGAARSRSSSIAAPVNAEPAPSTADPDPVKEEEVSVAQDVEMAAAAPTEDFGSPRVKRRRLSEIATQDRPTGLMFGSTQDDLSAPLPFLHSKLAFPAIEPIGAGQSGVDVGAEADGPVASTSTIFGAPARSQSGNTNDLDAYFPARAKARSSQANSRLPQWFNEPIREYTPEEIEDWRNYQIDRKEQELAEIVDRHDDYVRELFHLDRFVTLVGFDPAVAKEDKSDVFLSFQHEYDLFANAVQDLEAGPLGRRPSRRAANHRKSFDDEYEPAYVHPVIDLKGKGKAVAEPKGTQWISSGLYWSPEAEAAARRRGEVPSRGPVYPYKGSTVDTKPIIGTLADMSRYYTKPPESTVGHPPQKRRTLAPGEEEPTYSHHQQIPVDPPHNFSIPAVLESFHTWVDDDDLVEPPPPEDEMDERAEYEADIFVQVERLRAKGIELLNPDQEKPEEPGRSDDHRDFLITHAIHFSKLVHDERKAHLAIARKLGKMILAHFAGIRGKEERSARELERSQKALARWTMKEIKKKWKLAINVVKARRKASEKEERDRLGKEQLNAMLDKSTTMLQKQQVEMAGDSDAESTRSRSASVASGSDHASSSGSQRDEDEEGEEESQDAQDSRGASEDVREESAAATVASDADSIVASDSPAPPSSRRNGFGANRKRPLRSRSSLSVSVAPADSSVPPSDAAETEEGGDDDDDVFDGPADDAQDEEDEQMDVEMEAEDQNGADDDSEAELGGLAEEADMPIEELLRHSGYGAMLEAEAAAAAVQAAGSDEVQSDAAEDEATETADAPLATLINGHTVSPAPAADVDLTAEEVEAQAMSEFGSDDDADDDREDEDGQLEQEMEAEEAAAAGSEDDDVEMAGLAEDADLPIEELMRKYGYSAGAEDSTATSATGQPAEQVATASVNGKAESVAESSGAEEEEQDEDDEVIDEKDDEHSAKRDEASGEVGKAVNLRPPFLLRGSLRPYQQAGLEWLASLYTSGVNGILADEMGLGKTIQTISLLAHLACDKGQWGPHLVVVPTSVMLNWEMEFKKFLPGFKILTYYGTQKERKEKRRGWNTQNHFHVCITSYQLVLSDQHVFRRKPWHYMILDEAHHIKNFRSQRWQTLLGFNARHRLLLTGTPLQNNLMELWSLLYFLMPHGLMQDGKGPFADHADFQAWFSNPMEKAIETDETMDEETKATVAKLHTVLRPYLLRRLKAEVETQMPGKTESVIYCRLSKRQRFLYDEFMSRAQTRETLGSGHFLSIINCLMQLRKVCNHPDLFEVRPIVTSYAMNRSVANEYEPMELLVRRRLLQESEPIAQIDWSNLTLVKPELEYNSSTVAAQSAIHLDAAPYLTSLHPTPEDFDSNAPPPEDMLTILGWKKYYEWSQHKAALSRLETLAHTNTRRCRTAKPFFGRELLHTLRAPVRENAILPIEVPTAPQKSLETSTLVPRLVHSTVERADSLSSLVDKFAFVTPAVKAADLPQHALAGISLPQLHQLEEQAPADLLHRASVKLSVAFPDRSLLQYDCGKLQKLDELLRECKAGGHRALIFTQMTKVLDILEEFLSFHGHRYMRLDGSTKIEQRQVITERFNSDDSILCFISSTRAGGLGINLQGADTVIFYDSDWNPALDRQCQDRAHRIGQTREVRIWRFVTEHSIEENMLKKANQKRRLDELVIAEGDFTTDYLQKLDWRDYLDEKQLEELGVDQTDAAAVDGTGAEASAGGGAVKSIPTQSVQEIRQALAAAEDEEDAAAARLAVAEMEMDRSDFTEQQPASAATASGTQLGKVLHGEGSATPVTPGTGAQDSPAGAAGEDEDEEEDDDDDDDPLKGTVDGFMLKIADRYYDDLT